MKILAADIFITTLPTTSDSVCYDLSVIKSFVIKSSQYFAIFCVAAAAWREQSKKAPCGFKCKHIIQSICISSFLLFNLQSPKFSADHFMQSCGGPVV